MHGRSTALLVVFAICIPLVAQTPAPAPRPFTCPVTEGTRMKAPPEPNTSPVEGYFVLSPDQLLWAPVGSPGSMSTGVGMYWVRPAGTHLTFTSRRLDHPSPPIVSSEQGGYSSGFLYGGPSLPGEGCWEVKASTGTSEVTVVALLRETIQKFVMRPTVKITLSEQVGTIENGTNKLTVTAAVFEDPSSLTGSLRAARIDLVSSTSRDVLYEEVGRLMGTRTGLESWAGGRLPMIYGLGRTHNARGDASGFTVVGAGHSYGFLPEATAAFARLLLRAGDVLSK